MGPPETISLEFDIQKISQKQICVFFLGECTGFLNFTPIGRADICNFSGLQINLEYLCVFQGRLWDDFFYELGVVFFHKNEKFQFLQSLMCKSTALYLIVCCVNKMDHCVRTSNTQCDTMGQLIWAFGYKILLQHILYFNS